MNVNEVRSTPVPPPQVKQVEKKSSAAFNDRLKDASSVTRQAEVKDIPAALTTQEREFFEDLYPSSVDEIRTYNPYQRDGANTPAKLGAIIDRRG